MPRNPAANRTSPTASRQPPASSSGVVVVGTPTTTSAVPAFQASSCAPVKRREGGSVARNAQLKNCPAPSTSCETPPSSARCTAVQCSQSSPVTVEAIAAPAPSSRAQIAAVKKEIGRAHVPSHLRDPAEQREVHRGPVQPVEPGHGGGDCSAGA